MESPKLVGARAAGIPPAPHPRTGGAAPGEGRSFAEVLRASLDSVDRDGREVQRLIDSARRGHVYSSEELLAVQAVVYRYTQEVELASRLVDKSTSAVRSTLQSQQ